MDKLVASKALTNATVARAKKASLNAHPFFAFLLFSVGSMISKSENETMIGISLSETFEERKSGSRSLGSAAGSGDLTIAKKVRVGLQDQI